MTNEDIPDEPKPVMPWDLLNPNQPRSTKELKAERLAICAECPLYNSFAHTCTICKCFMKMKTKLAHAYCPIHKW
jgi:hypothetical protein